MSLDLTLFNAIHELVGKSRIADLAAFFIADYFGYLLVGWALYAIFTHQDWRKRYIDFFLLSLSLILARGIIGPLVRFLYSRPRPFAALGFEPLVAMAPVPGFPSGHATFYFALAMAMQLVNPRQGWGFFLGAALIGFARVYAGVHWPLDIAAGAFIGVASACFVRQLLSPSFAHYETVRNAD